MKKIVVTNDVGEVVLERELDDLVKEMRLSEDGPWKNEPDLRMWYHQRSAYMCVIRRNPHIGVLCGYVGIPGHHPFYGKHLSLDEAIQSIRTHRGVSYTGEIVPLTEIADARWWIGFDCGHYGDILPYGTENMTRLMKEAGAEYRDINYVTEQCELLADHLYNVELGQWKRQP